MKKLSLLFAFVALTATATFAATEPKQDVIKVEYQYDQPSEAFTNEKKATKAIADFFVENTCTVSATWTSGGKKVSATISITCDCTAQQACDVAYKLLSIAIPEK